MRADCAIDMAAPVSEDLDNYPREARQAVVLRRGDTRLCPTLRSGETSPYQDATSIRLLPIRCQSSLLEKMGQTIGVRSYGPLRKVGRTFAFELGRQCTQRLGRKSLDSLLGRQSFQPLLRR